VAIGIPLLVIAAGAILTWVVGTDDLHTVGVILLVAGLAALAVGLGLVFTRERWGAR